MLTPWRWSLRSAIYLQCIPHIWGQKQICRNYFKQWENFNFQHFRNDTLLVFASFIHNTLLDFLTFKIAHVREFVRECDRLIKSGLIAKRRKTSVRIFDRCNLETLTSRDTRHLRFDVKLHQRVLIFVKFGHLRVVCAYVQLHWVIFFDQSPCRMEHNFLNVRDKDLGGGRHRLGHF